MEERRLLIKMEVRDSLKRCDTRGRIVDIMLLLPKGQSFDGYIDSNIVENYTHECIEPHARGHVWKVDLEKLLMTYVQGFPLERFSSIPVLSYSRRIYPEFYELILNDKCNRFELRPILFTGLCYDKHGYGKYDCYEVLTIDETYLSHRLVVRELKRLLEC